MSRSTAGSAQLFTEAKRLLPGGVDSPVRAFGSVGGTPIFIAKGDGAWLTDVDGNRYIDYVLSYGPLIVGHAHPAVVEAVIRQAERGMTYGAPTEAESDASGNDLRRPAVDGDAPVRLVGNRSRHERGSPGACLYPPPADLEVRWRVSRACRFIPGAGRIRSSDVGTAG